MIFVGGFAGVQWLDDPEEIAADLEEMSRMRCRDEMPDTNILAQHRTELSTRCRTLELVSSLLSA